MNSMRLLFFFQFIVLFSFSQKNTELYKSFYFSINQQIIDKKVLLFDGTPLNYDPLKDLEFIDNHVDSLDVCNKQPILLNANKISRERLMKTNPQLAKDTSISFMCVDPITGDPLIYSKERLKLYYNAWKKEFLTEKKIVRDIDKDSLCLIIYVEHVQHHDVNIGVYTKFKDHKVEFIVRDLGKVRTKKNRNLSGSYGVTFSNLNPILNWYKLKQLKQFKQKMDALSVDFMDFILNEGDFIERTTDQLVNFYWPNFNF